MKYAHLVQIAAFLSKFKKINSIKRVGDMLLLIEFEREDIFFDLAKSGSAIYKDENFKQTKIYQAPFDNVLKKRLNSAHIQSVECLKNNRILKFTCTQSGSYKSLVTKLYLEFTGRFTNAIITDEKDIILEALRHIDNSYRKIEVGEVLKELEPIEIKEKPSQEIADFDKFLKDEFAKINEQNLANLRAIKLAVVQKKLESLEQNLRSLEKKDELLKQSEHYAHIGSLLLANLSHFKGYEREITLRDFDGEILNLSLEDTPKNSANDFYAKSKRLRAKALGVQLEGQNLGQKIEFLNGLRSLLQEASSVGELEILSPKRPSRQREKEARSQSENVQSFYVKDFKILIGRNEKGNVELLKNARKDDVWLHVKDVPSAHVIIKTNKTKLDEEVLRFCAKICVEFSVKGAGSYEVDYTRRENVKILSGANVNYINFKTIIINKR